MKTLSRRQDLPSRHSFIDVGVQQAATLAKTSPANPDSAKWDCWAWEVGTFLKTATDFPA